MATYTVVRDFYVAEFNVQLQPGQVFADGDAEPDLVAQLVVSGIIVDANAPAPVVEGEPVVKASRASKKRVDEDAE